MTPPNPKSKRLYQVWKGNNRFFCGGRCIFGPDVASVLFSVLLITSPIITFCYQIISKIIDYKKLHEDVIRDFHHVLGFPVLVATIILILADLSFLLLTSSRDPGIIPRNIHPVESSEISDMNTPSMEWIIGTTPQMKVPRTKDVILNGFAIKIKYCETCLLYRPPRTSHCSICNNCVQKFDHHCPWVGQCIGLRNYRFFFLFVSTSAFLCIYVFTLSILNILQERKNYHTFIKLIIGEIISVILMIYAFLSVWFVGGLSIFHLYLICTNQTTYENFRFHYDENDNPFNKGVWNNIKEVFFSSISPSMNSFRARMLDKRAENELYSSSLGLDIVSSFEKVGIEMTSTIEVNKNEPICASLQNIDYRFNVEKQGAINKLTGEPIGQSNLSNALEHDQISGEFKSCIGDYGSFVECQDQMTKGETLMYSMPNED